MWLVVLSLANIHSGWTGGGALTSTWRRHVCPDAAHVQVHLSIQRLFNSINDLGDCITVAVFQNCTDLHMKNTFTLKPPRQAGLR